MGARGGVGAAWRAALAVAARARARAGATVTGPRSAVARPAPAAASAPLSPFPALWQTLARMLQCETRIDTMCACC